jgi:hypothetical protein
LCLRMFPISAKIPYCHESRLRHFVMCPFAHYCYSSLYALVLLQDAANSGYRSYVCGARLVRLFIVKLSISGHQMHNSRTSG